MSLSEFMRRNLEAHRQFQGNKSAQAAFLSWKIENSQRALSEGTLTHDEAVTRAGELVGAQRLQARAFRAKATETSAAALTGMWLAGAVSTFTVGNPQAMETYQTILPQQQVTCSPDSAPWKIQEVDNGDVTPLRNTLFDRMGAADLHRQAFVVTPPNPATEQRLDIRLIENPVTAYGDQPLKVTAQCIDSEGATTEVTPTPLAMWEHEVAAIQLSNGGNDSDKISIRSDGSKVEGQSLFASDLRINPDANKGHLQPQTIHRETYCDPTETTSIVLSLANNPQSSANSLRERSPSRNLKQFCEGSQSKPVFEGGLGSTNIEQFEIAETEAGGVEFGDEFNVSDHDVAKLLDRGYQ